MSDDQLVGEIKWTQECIALAAQCESEQRERGKQARARLASLEAEKRNREPIEVDLHVQMMECMSTQHGEFLDPVSYVAPIRKAIEPGNYRATLRRIR